MPVLGLNAFMNIPFVPSPLPAGAVNPFRESEYRIRHNDNEPDVEGNIDTDPEGPPANLWINMRYRGYGTVPMVGINEPRHVFIGEVSMFFTPEELANYTFTDEHPLPAAGLGGKRRRHRRKTTRKTRRSRLTRRR